MQGDGDEDEDIDVELEQPSSASACRRLADFRGGLGRDVSLSSPALFLAKAKVCENDCRLSINC